jgi:outer membrane protein assembly factor BamB
LHSTELDAEETRRVQQHVESCAWCQHQLALYDALDGTLRQSFGGPNIPFLSLEEIMRDTNQTDTAPSWVVEPLTPPTTQRRRPGRFSGLAAVAAAILVIAFAGVVFAQRGAFLGRGVSPSSTAHTAKTASPASPVASPPPAGTNLYYGTNGSTGGLYALHSSDGSAEWQITGPNFEIAPVVVNGIVYAVSADNVLYAIRAPAQGGTTGNILWHVALVRPGAALLVTDGQSLYIGFSVTPTESTNAHGFIDAYSLSGQHLWAYGYDSGDSASCAMSTLPGEMTAANGFVYASSNCLRELVVALHSSNGSPAFTINSTLSPGTSIAAGEGLTVAGNVLYASSAVSGSGSLCAFNAGQGGQYWCRHLSGQDIEMTTSAPVVENGVVLVTTDLDIYALRVADGTQLWSKHIGQLLGRPAGSNGVVYVAGGDRVLHALRVADGMQLWQYAMAGNGSDPVVAGGAVYLNSYLDGTGYILTALRTSDGSRLWKQTIVTTGATIPVAG